MPLLFDVGGAHAKMRSCSPTSTISTFVVRSFANPRRHQHGGKTKVWNMAGECPPVCDVLEQIARVSDPTARVWWGSGRQNVRGSRFWAPQSDIQISRSHLVDLVEEQHVLLERIPMLWDVQGAWPSGDCASARANCVVRCVRPEAVAQYARVHDAQSHLPV